MGCDLVGCQCVVVAVNARFIAGVHGNLALLAAAILIIATISLWQNGRATRSANIATVAAGLLVGVPYLLGVAIYEPYRQLVKPLLLKSAPHAAMLFETKEHIALFIISFSLGGAWVAYFSGPESRDANRLVARFYACASAFFVLVIVLGKWIRAVKSF